MFDHAQIDDVYLDHHLDHHHHIHCMFCPCPLGPGLLVLMDDKNVLGSRKKQVCPLVAKNITNDKTVKAIV